MSSRVPLLTYDQEHDAEDVFENGHSPSYHEKKGYNDTRSPKMQYISRAFQFLTRVLAIWGIVSLGLQASSALQPSSSSSGHSSHMSQSHKAISKIDGYHPEVLPPLLNLCDCGTSIREAISRNCTYDTLATAWLPPYCRDDELTAEFDKAGPGPDGAWAYFADEEGKVPLNKSEVAALGDTGGSFWASRDWHIAHCLFYWQKYHRMRHTKIIMEERFDSLHHVKHCGRLIRNPTPDHFFLIEVPVTMNSSKDA
ncbi:hypothetical protein J3459_011874 [Metarhizium acridum]|uniref:Uncharacterized protein n=1 Tax=Metarhizium acridum (strain CQMa 102) TaxID=655827 RepID=E9EG67_METAQ|nr:uncharacterized protein MAC_08865 [Metarhizium acridum CQMa 102]EFY85105.1 hypothetical protein MAC_08865 [Metarhizium acridum CQMa 102]KAG8415782.1 hypothetical protein J3458_009602 [Metarhizium acridum]KAG8418958.1 hypothetical protein J3459_011874 [Metarhizium acridum]